MNGRITIRSTTYRGDPGYNVRGTDALGRELSIFVMAQWQAEAIKRTVKTGGSSEAISAIMRARP